MSSTQRDLPASDLGVGLTKGGSELLQSVNHHWLGIWDAR